MFVGSFDSKSFRDCQPFKPPLTGNSDAGCGEGCKSNPNSHPCNPCLQPCTRHPILLPSALPTACPGPCQVRCSGAGNPLLIIPTGLRYILLCSMRSFKVKLGESSYNTAHLDFITITYLGSNISKTMQITLYIRFLPSFRSTGAFAFGREQALF